MFVPEVAKVDPTFFSSTTGSDPPCEGSKSLHELHGMFVVPVFEVSEHRKTTTSSIAGFFAINAVWHLPDRVQRNADMLVRSTMALERLQEVD